MGRSWLRTFFAALYDLQMRLTRGSLEPRRRQVTGQTTGRVLDLGVGTGQNLPFYPASAWVIGLDPQPAMLRRAGQRLRDSVSQVHLVAGNGEHLPFVDAVFDEVVATLVFCSVSDPDGTLAEVRRVLRPGGRLRFFEHVRAPTPGWARMQDLLAPLWVRVAGG